MYDHTFYKQVQISRSDIRPHIKWAVSLVILHMITKTCYEVFSYICNDNSTIFYFIRRLNFFYLSLNLERGGGEGGVCTINNRLTY